MGVKPLCRQCSVHLAAQVNQACLAECWAEGCFHVLKSPVLAKGNLLSLHKDFHGCEINQLSLESKCNRLCFEENTECVSCHFCREDKEGVCVCVCLKVLCTSETAALWTHFPRNHCSWTGPWASWNHWNSSGSPSKNIHISFFSISIGFSAAGWRVLMVQEIISSPRRDYNGKLLSKFIVETLPPSGKTLHLLSACQPLWNGTCILIH